MTTVTSLPAFDVIAAALRETTERLAAEVAAPSMAPPVWSDFEWTIAQAASAMHGVSGLLANRLRWSGPDRWRKFLTEQRRQSELRDERLADRLRRIDAAARHAELGCIALKGSALRPLGIYRPGERPMGDIDLLVRGAGVPTLDRALRSLGYVPTLSMDRHTAYAPRAAGQSQPFGEHIDNPLKIEVHVRIAEALPVRMIDVTSRLTPACLHPGINPYRSVPALLLHLLLHAAGNMRANALRLIQLHDIAAIAMRFGPAEWNELLSPDRDRVEHGWEYPPLALTERYYPGTIPQRLLDRLRRTCARALRAASDQYTLTGVSWSNLRIPAFPGIEWANTPLEVLRYVRSRALPSRRALKALEDAAVTQPLLDAVPWYRLSHGARIARWVFSRPPRVQTMFCVRAALQRAAMARGA